MSQAQLAGDELTKGFISQLESGLARPSIRSLQVLANRLGKPLDYFLGDEPLAAGKRLDFHRLAAEAAAEREEWSEVRGQVGLAIEQSPEPRERAQLLRFLAQADVADKDPETAFERISAALGVIETANEPAEAAQLLYTRGAAYSLMGQLVAATEAFEACRDIIERFEVVEPRLRAKLMVALGTIYRRLNRTTKALSAYESALAIASRSSEIAMAARGYMGIAVSMYDSGELDGAISNYRRALELFRKVSDTEFELSVLQSLAAVHFEQGEIDTARVAAERAMKRAIEVGSSHWAAVAEVVL
ncbi:MAG: helix-turn-helix transcriptional regulator, partial [Chloroflexota bacterium]